jgi:hypothetical protein
MHLSLHAVAHGSVLVRTEGPVGHRPSFSASVKIVLTLCTLAPSQKSAQVRILLSLTAVSYPSVCPPLQPLVQSADISLFIILLGPLLRFLSLWSLLRPFCGMLPRAFDP